jgi:hypothetical protein
MDSYCTGKNCSDVRVTEWNYAAEDVNARNDTMLYLGTLLGYLAFIDSNVSRYGGNLFNWQESVACTSSLNQYYPDNYCAVNEPLLGDTQRPTYNATINFSSYANYNSVLWNYTKNDNEVFAAFTNNTTRIKGIIINGDSVRKNITIQTNGILNPYRIVASNGTIYSYVSNSFNIGLEAYTPLFFEMDFSTISFSSYYPLSNPSVDAGQSQLFNFSINNLASLPTNTTWYLDGTNITGCYNQTSCTLTTLTTDNTQTYTVNITIESSTNNITRSWNFSVIGASDQALNDICGDGSGATGELASWLPTIALVISSVVVIGTINMYRNGSVPDFGIGDLGTIVMILVGTAITIAVAANIITSAIC